MSNKVVHKKDIKSCMLQKEKWFLINGSISIYREYYDIMHVFNTYRVDWGRYVIAFDTLCHRTRPNRIGILLKLLLALFKGNTNIADK